MFRKLVLFQFSRPDIGNSYLRSSRHQRDREKSLFNLKVELWRGHLIYTQSFSVLLTWLLIYPKLELPLSFYFPSQTVGLEWMEVVERSKHPSGSCRRHICVESGEFTEYTTRIFVVATENKLI